MKQGFELAKNIRKARVSGNLSQKQLAERLGITDKTISAYETGRATPPATTLFKIAEITGSSISEIADFYKPISEKEISERLSKIEKKISYLGFGNGTPSKLNLDAFTGVVLTDKNSRIYLVKEEDKHNISKNRWNLPSGSVESEEGFVQAVIREMKEKTGFDIDVNSLLGCYKCKSNQSSWTYIVFGAKLAVKETKRTKDNTRTGKWFSKEEFLNLDPAKIVHPEMQLVYKIALENKGLDIESVKFIDYDKN